MAESVGFALVRQFAAQRGAGFAEVERALYGDLPAAPPARTSRALVRHAVFAATPTARVSPLAARHPSRALKPPEIAADVREEYAYELAELAGRYMDAGHDETEADRLALDDMGCVEFWDYARERRDTLRRSCAAPSPAVEDVFCSRCESVGHAARACPFPAGAADVLKIAALRRERRGERAA